MFIKNNLILASQPIFIEFYIVYTVCQQMSMKYTHLRFVLSIAIGMSCFMAQAQQASALLAGAKKTIQALAAPEMHGRGYIKNGDKIAAEFIGQAFEKAGLKAFNDSYFQKFPININVFPRRMRLRIGGKKLKPGIDFIIHPTSKKGKGRGKLRWLDTLLLQEPTRLKSFLTSNISKNILVYKATYMRKLRQSNKVPKKFFDKLQESKAAIELHTKLTAGFASKPVNRPILMVQTSSFDITARRAKFAIDNKHLQRYTTQNVIGYIEGQHEPDSFMVFTAHYDHMGRMGKRIYFPGANDNASGIALLLELAKYYSQNKPKHSMMFIAFGAEEVGLIGSYYYVKNPTIDLGNIKFLVNFDMVGTGDDGIKVVNGSVYRKEFDRLTAINQKKKLLPDVKIRGRAPISDHYFFTQNGVPGFYIYTLGGIKAYHDIFDRYETLPLTKFEQFFKLITTFADSF